MSVGNSPEEEVLESEAGTDEENAIARWLPLLKNYASIFEMAGSVPAPPEFSRPALKGLHCLLLGIVNLKYRHQLGNLQDIAQLLPETGQLDLRA